MEKDLILCDSFLEDFSNMRFNPLKFLFLRRRRPRFGLLAFGGGLFLALFLIYIITTIFVSEESAVEKFIFKGAEALEDKDIETIGFMISESYDGAIGKTGKEALDIAGRQLGHTENLNIKIRKIEILLQEENTVKVKCVFDYSGYYLASNVYHRAPLSSRFLQDAKGEAELDLIRENGNWLLRHVSFVLNDHRYY